ncbi:MAG TPA: glycerol kinase [Lachnospiraceae bacterium]|nr:glycerol kinase [Lachnospiraceae bacterium]
MYNQNTSKRYIIGIDQSTQGTKALLFDENGQLLCREDLAHRQIVNEAGWVSHDPEEIYQNTLRVVRQLITNTQEGELRIDSAQIAGIGISNQRETALIWDMQTGKPLADAVVWQCSRSQKICDKIEASRNVEFIQQKTGLKLSPYFPASKLAWLMANVEGAGQIAKEGRLGMGTVDTWLVYKLTGGASYKTDYSNASRTQLFDIFNLRWDKELCEAFGLSPEYLPEVCDSDSHFGMTDFEGLLPEPVPIHGVLGDSHAALFGQGCIHPGMAKATYGTGSSIMMNTGTSPVQSKSGVVTSLAWKLGNEASYVLEGNINYTGAAITWLKDEVRLINSPKETEELSRMAVQDDSLYFIPAFTGLGAPYWNSQAKGLLCGITRTTGRKEIVRAAVESIAYQIADIVETFAKDTEGKVKELRVDGGPSGNAYLMQFQSDLLDTDVSVPQTEEMSGMGAAYVAGIALGLYDKQIVETTERKVYKPAMASGLREKKKKGWKDAISMIL